MKRILLIALALLLLCSCGGNTSKASYTLAHVDEVLNSGAFEGSEMEPLDSRILPILYGIDSDTLVESSAYMAINTSLSADELAVFILTDEDAAIAVEEACKARVLAQLSVCKSYCPQAVPRLESAFISRRGNTVMMIVGDPEVIASLKGIQ